MFVTRCVLIVVDRLLPVGVRVCSLVIGSCLFGYCLLHGDCYVLRYCSFRGVRCSLCVACCLFVVCCLLFVVGCVLLLFCYTLFVD